MVSRRVQLAQFDGLDRQRAGRCAGRIGIGAVGGERVIKVGGGFGRWKLDACWRRRMLQHLFWPLRWFCILAGSARGLVVGAIIFECLIVRIEHLERKNSRDENAPSVRNGQLKSYK